MPISGILQFQLANQYIDFHHFFFNSNLLTPYIGTNVLFWFIEGDDGK